MFRSVSDTKVLSTLLVMPNTFHRSFTKFPSARVPLLLTFTPNDWSCTSTMARAYQLLAMTGQSIPQSTCSLALLALLIVFLPYSGLGIAPLGLVCRFSASPNETLVDPPNWHLDCNGLLPCHVLGDVGLGRGSRAVLHRVAQGSGVCSISRHKCNALIMIVGSSIDLEALA